MQRAVVVDAVRTPTGKRSGKLDGYHPVDLAAITLRALVERNDLDPGLVDDVIMGCVMQTGEQGLNVGRNAALAAGFPEEVVGTTIDRQCGSGQQSSHFAAQGVMAGAYDVAIAGGVESMTRVPMGITAHQGPGKPFGPRMVERYARTLVPQGISAEMIAEKWGLSRESLDRIAFDSHMRAARATERGRFDREVIPVEVGANGSSETMVADEGIRPDTSMEVLAGLRPVFKPDGVVTAGNSSQISDGAAAVLIMSESKAEELRLAPKASFVQFALAGVDPVTMLTGPIPATAKVLDRCGLTVDDIDLFEVNEAFASVVGMWLAEYGGSDPDALWGRTNVHEMERRKARYGLQTMCEGGGMANAMILERVA